MIITKNQMTQIWRSALGLDSVNPDAALDRDDAFAIDPWIERSARRWYLDALDNAPLSALVPEDRAAELSELLSQPDASLAVGIAKLPEHWRRVCSVQLFGWLKPALVADAAGAPQLMARLSSSYALPGVAEPVALISAGYLFVAPLVRRQALRCLVVADPGPDSFVLHESLLSTIPANLAISNL